VLLQAVQHDGLCAIKQTADSGNWNTHTYNGMRLSWAAAFKQLPSIYFFHFISSKSEMY
jgi:hypothetical protein